MYMSIYDDESIFIKLTHNIPQGSAAILNGILRIREVREWRLWASRPSNPNFLVDIIPMWSASNCYTPDRTGSRRTRRQFSTADDEMMWAWFCQAVVVGYIRSQPLRETVLVNHSPRANTNPSLSSEVKRRIVLRELVGISVLDNSRPPSYTWYRLP